MAAEPVPPTELPPLGPGEYHELRVHGVAGTSAESMLGLAARLQATGTGPAAEVRGDGSGARDLPVAPDCAVQPAPGDVSVWEPPEVDPRLRAFSWSSPTSGHWYQAGYLLLLPFMIANLAGWMVVGPTAVGGGPTVRVSVLLVRAIGLLITGVFVVSIQIVVADLVVFQWLHRDHDWPVAIGAP